MRSMLRNLVLAPALLASAAAFAATTAVKVPFDFVAQGKLYHAGTYDISNETGSGFLTLRNHALPTETFKLTAGAGGELNNTVRLKFDNVGDTKVLHSVQYGPLMTARLDPEKKHGDIDHSSMAVGR
jgi:hypothetical protein